MRMKLKMRFSEFVRRYSIYKYEETGIRHVTESERKNLIKEFNKISEKKIDSQKKRVNEGTSEKRMSRYAEMRHGNRSNGRKMSKEIKELREAFEANSLKKKRLGGQKRVTEKKLDSIQKKLHEASFHVRRANRLLKENDMAGAEMAVDNATNAVDAVNDMTAGANVPPEVQTQIQSVMAAVEQLANVAGLATQNDMNGNVDANVPPAEGMGVVDENSTMFERAMFRRSTLLEEINIPQAKKIASGVSKYSGKTWKPAAIKYSKTGSLTETQREDEKMVDELLNEKTFNYKDLFAKGILG